MVAQLELVLPLGIINFIPPRDLLRYAHGVPFVGERAYAVIQASRRNRRRARIARYLPDSASSSSAFRRRLDGYRRIERVAERKERFAAAALRNDTREPRGRTVFHPGELSPGTVGSNKQS